MKSRQRLAVIALGVLAVGSALVGLAMRRGGPPICAEGFRLQDGRCLPEPGQCPSPLVRRETSCRPPDVRVEIRPMRVELGPSDWEAEGRVAPRTIDARAFRIDAFEVVEEDVTAWRRMRDPASKVREEAEAAVVPARSIAFDEARRYCQARGGDLPTDAEWIVSVVGEEQTRYPWGAAGAVCRRAAFGREHGPCAEGAAGPDAVGAHPFGATPSGIFDLSGNVAEWVRGPEDRPEARGGSYATTLAAELRAWAYREVPGGAPAPDIGFRCAYPVRVGPSARGSQSAGAQH